MLSSATRASDAPPGAALPLFAVEEVEFSYGHQQVLFGVSPVSLNDRLAMPQHEAFLARLADGPHPGAYTATRPLVPFALNAAGAPGPAESESMDFSTVDRIDEQLLNAILYADARGSPSLG